MTEKPHPRTEQTYKMIYDALKATKIAVETAEMQQGRSRELALAQTKLDEARAWVREAAELAGL